MRFPVLVALILGAFPAGSASSTGAAAAASTESLYEPARISFDELVDGRSGDYNRGENDVFWESLHQVGLLSITDIPDFDKQLMLKDLEDCLHRQDVGAPEFHLTQNTHTNDNGHNRRTLATRTLAGTPEGILAATTNSKQEELPSEQEDTDPGVCDDLKVSSERFRTAVQKVSEAIAARFGAMESSVVLEENTNTRISIETLINEGEHLEHFHSYYSTNTATTGTASTSTASTTIDWHTDQGMMLLFTPGQFQDGTTPNGFFIRLGDGSTAEIAFDSNIDDLVIMLGDGVNQYINPSGDAPFLRAVPHAVTLPNNNNNSESSPRLWYGRMVLPPPRAIHPSGNGITFEEHRTAMIQGDVDALSLGCASSTMVARELTERMLNHGPKECEVESDMLCWMTCQSTLDIIDACTSLSANHSIYCANDSGEVWNPSIHSASYKLRCFAEQEVSGISMDHDPFHHEHDGMDGMDMDHGGMDMEGMEMEESSAAGIVPGLVVGMTMAMIAAMR